MKQWLVQIKFFYIKTLSQNAWLQSSFWGIDGCLIQDLFSLTTTNVVEGDGVFVVFLN